MHASELAGKITGTIDDVVIGKPPPEMTSNMFG
jgi:hypothetical protein